MLDKIRIILVETSHTGNIGQAARAMLNMHMSQLYLVNPKNKPDSHTEALASHADNLVKDAKIVNSLTEALEGCDLIIGTSARTRRMNLPMLSIEGAATQALEQAKYSKTTAIVFGRERTGLFNEELLMCHLHAYIPTNEQYNSLNLAQAVQVSCYEIYKQSLQAINQAPLPQVNHTRDKASIKELQSFYHHLEEKLIEVGFLNPEQPGHVVDKLKRLFQRAQLESQEINILRGFLSHIEKSKS